MRLFQLFHLILSAHIVHSFVYSCEEVLFKLMNSTFEQYTKYAYVFTEEGFSNWVQLDQIFLKWGEDTLYSFSYMAQNHCVNMGKETIPWTIVADNPSMKCDQEFTLILKSDETKLVIPERNAINKLFGGSGVFVVPQVGMMLEKMSMSGEGKISMYSGAGSGEEEERYLLQSWECSSMPSRIWSFEIVITILADDSCSLMMQYISNFDYNVNIFRNDRLAILSSGRSDNLQNREGIELIVYVVIGEWEESDVTVDMQLTFDSNNDGSVGIMEQFAGPVDPYYASTTVQFYTDYFEIRWSPKKLHPWQISSNQDMIHIDIHVTHSNDEFECPDGSELFSAVDENWCFTIHGPIPPSIGFTFLEAAELCRFTDDFLPIVTSQEMNNQLAKFINDFDVLEEVWLGLICNPANDTWVWQDGQSLEYSAFEDEPGACSKKENVAIDQETWRIQSRQSLLGKAVCARRALQSTTSISTDSTTLTDFVKTSIGSSNTQVPSTDTISGDATSTVELDTTKEGTQTSTLPTTTLTTSQSPATSTDREGESTGLAAWEIALIVLAVIILVCGCGIGIFLIIRRRRSLREQMIEAKMEIRTISQQARKHYGISISNDEWEIDRRFVGIDYMNKLGEGAFGCVYLGRVLAKNLPSGMGRSIVELSSLTNQSDTVAVKMLHENADSQIERDFTSEIDLMKRIGYHERLVNMLACVTTSRPILLICEYCANGDLLGFLRQRRKFMLEHPDDNESAQVITVKKQLMFAIQIAYGLEYLASRGFIHRDVAARNVMVDQNEGCKIGDFGLGRSVGRENENYHAQGGKLPLKWMSPEALDKYYFSTAADVWSYGVLLFEIVTLGGVPYAGWPAVELLSRLKRGDRMDRPDNCSEKLFEIMCECWSELPSDRPTFTQLRKELGDLLENVSRDEYYLKLDAHANYYVMESQASE